MKKTAAFYCSCLLSDAQHNLFLYTLSQNDDPGRIALVEK